MKGYLRHVAACNPPIDEPFRPWLIDGRVVGWMRPRIADELRRYPQVFRVGDSAVQLVAGLDGFDARSAALDDVARGLADDGVIPPHQSEPYAVTPGGRELALCVVDRAAAAAFGVRAFGQHVNGYVRCADGIRMWLGRRSRDRLLFPGALDNMVAGGLPYGLELEENLVKECAEEAGLDAALSRTAVPTGAVSYVRAAPRGLRRDVLYCYDLALPEDFVPRNTDGEVEEFLSLPLAEVAAIVHETDDFKPNCNLVVIDFLIRHGWLDPRSPEYLSLVWGLRRPLDNVDFPAGGGV